MKKILFFTLMALCGIASTQAATVTPEAAKQVAAQYLKAQMQKHRMQGKDLNQPAPDASVLSPKVLFDATNEDGAPYVYAVQAEQGGFVLVSGDDRFAPVLGYSTSGSLDPNQMPDNMRTWLQGYVDEMRYLESIGYTFNATAKNTSSAVKTAIAPLLTTQWNQSAPYNNLCPVDPKTSKRSVTGCVATAMAQVVNYHMQHYNAPTAITTKIDSYTTTSREIKVSGVAAGTALPDRSLLTDTYNDKSTAEENNAVAKLMFYCGVSVQMDYTSGTSSAYGCNVAVAMVKNFGFDASTRCESRDKYTYAAWIDLMYSELAAARPVVFGGQSSTGGHEFVVDGYDGDDLFHINWGWGGTSDDYFALSVLKPSDNNQIGASGSSDGYSGGQEAIIGCQILGEPYDAGPNCLTMKLKRVNNDTVFMSAFNYTGETRNFQFGLAYEESNGTLTVIGYSDAPDLKNVWGYPNAWRTIPSNKAYANQTKKMVGISREKGTTNWCVADNSDFNYITATFNANGVPQLTLHPMTALRGEDLGVKTSKFVNEKQLISMTLINEGDECYSSFYLFVSQTNEKGSYYLQRGITVLANSSQTISYDWTPDKTGTYNLWVASDEKGNEVLASASVTITEDIALQGKQFGIIRINLNGLDANTWVIDNETGKREVDVYADSISGTVSVKNLTGAAVESFDLRIEFDRYNESTDTYTNEKSGSYYPYAYEVDQYYNFTVSRKPTVRPTGYTYRIRISKRPRSTSTATNYDDHYLIHLYPAKKDLTAEGITVSEIAEQTYTGSPITPAVTVLDGDEDITSHCDIYYSNNIEAGTASVTIVAKASSKRYKGKVRTTFVIAGSGDSTDIEPVHTDGAQCTKVLRDGQLFIIREGKIYTIQGILVGK